MSRLLVSLSFAASFVVLTVVVLVPTPVGACSIADPCFFEVQEEGLTGLTVEVVAGDVDAVAPEWAVDDAALEYDGNGVATALLVDGKRFTLGPAQ